LKVIGNFYRLIKLIGLDSSVSIPSRRIVNPLKHSNLYKIDFLKTCSKDKFCLAGGFEGRAAAVGEVFFILNLRLGFSSPLVLSFLSNSYSPPIVVL
jgi:hypothetical protein